MDKLDRLLLAVAVVALVLVMIGGLAIADPFTFSRAGAPQAAAVITSGNTTTIVYLGGEQSLVVGGFRIVGDVLRVTADEYTVTVPRPEKVRDWVDVPAGTNLTVYALNAATGEFVQVGKL